MMRNLANFSIEELVEELRQFCASENCSAKRVEAANRLERMKKSIQAYQAMQELNTRGGRIETLEAEVKKQKGTIDFLNETIDILREANKRLRERNRELSDSLNGKIAIVSQVGYLRQENVDLIEEVEMLRQRLGPSIAVVSGDPEGSPPLPECRRYTLVGRDIDRGVYLYREA
jgi:septal ring factor EnvC (AmiA/AmiB activator)